MTLAAVFPPMVTPFTHGEVDAAAIRWNVERWMQAGLGGVVALGTNGEAALLDESESDRVLGVCRDAVPPGRLLIAGTGRESTRATMAATARAAALGADYALVRTPSFFRTQMTAPALIKHFTAVRTLNLHTRLRPRLRRINSDIVRHPLTIATCARDPHGCYSHAGRENYFHELGTHAGRNYFRLRLMTEQ